METTKIDFTDIQAVAAILDAASVGAKIKICNLNKCESHTIEKTSANTWVDTSVFRLYQKKVNSSTQARQLCGLYFNDYTITFIN